MLSRFRSSSASTQESTQEKIQEIKWFGRAYSIGRQTTNKRTINQEDYKSISITKTSNHSIFTFLTLSFLFSPPTLSLFCSRHTRREQPPATIYCSNHNFSAALTKREGFKRINRVQELSTWTKAEFGPKNPILMHMQSYTINIILVIIIIQWH
jgi:hypothetical protein